MSDDATSVDETTAAYNILKLAGKIEIPQQLSSYEEQENLKRLSQLIVSPLATLSAQSERQTHLISPVEKLNKASAITDDSLAQITQSSIPYSAKSSQLCSIEIGPFVGKRELKKATEILEGSGFNICQSSGTGKVKFFRLLEGVYPASKALNRLEELNEVIDSAFILREKGQLAVYAGSYHRNDQAVRARKLLAQKQIKATVVPGEVEIQGKMVVVQQVDLQTAHTIVEQMSRLVLNTKIIFSDTKSPI